jgi:hypothetical protein
MRAGERVLRRLPSSTPRSSVERSVYRPHEYYVIAPKADFAERWPCNAWLPKEMQPIADLCSAKQAHAFVRGLTLCHLDAVLRRQTEAQRFLVSDIEEELAGRGVDVIVQKP